MGAPRAPRRAAALAAALLAALLASPGLAAKTPRGLASEAIIRTVPLADVAGCGTESLQGDLGADCIFQGKLGPDETVVFTFNVPERGTPMVPPLGDFDLMVQLRTVAGAAKLGMVTPKRTAPPSYDSAGGTLYSTLFNSEEFIAVAAEYLLFNTGAWSINVTATSDEPTFFSVSIFTPLATSLLAAEEVQVMQDLYDQCCHTGAASLSALCSKYLPAVTKPGRAPEADLCRMPPTTCSAQGKLLQLALPGAGLNCNGLGLPASFTKLTELQILDVAYNEIGGTTQAMADIVGALPNLQRAYLRYSNLSGPLPCKLVDNPALKTLSLTGNKNLEGTIPECMLNDPTLEELYISDTSLTGGLPDVVPASSPLRVIFAVGSSEGGSAALEGTIPQSLGNALDLVFLDLKHNNFAGAIPALADGLRFLDVSNNQLTSLPEALPTELEVFDASFNALQGTIPEISRNMIRITLDNNQLSGPLPALEKAARRRFARKLAQGKDDFADPDHPQLRTASFSSNKLTGAIPAEWATVPQQLRYWIASRNQLSGTLPWTWDLPELAWLDLSYNALEGPLPAALGNSVNLIHLDLSHNDLSGELKSFAATLAEGSQRLAHLDLSANYLSGPIPQEIENNNVLNLVSVPTLGATPVKRVLDISDNAFSGGPFPMFLLESIPREVADCSGCAITVKVNGPEAVLACPNPEEGAPFKEMLEEDRRLLATYQFNCTAGDGSTRPLLDVLDGSAAGPRDLRPVEVPPPAARLAAAAAASGGGRGGGKGGMKPGAIAGLVVGILAGLALVAGAAVFIVKYTRHWRDGYAKESLNGAGAAGPAAAGRSSRPGSRAGARVGGGWGARVAARDAGADAFGVMPAPPTAGSRRDSGH